MSESSDQEKTEQPTQRRIEKSREDGQVARSRELNTCLILLSAVGVLWFSVAHLYQTLSGVFIRTFAFDRKRATDESAVLALLQDAFGSGLWALTPLFAIVFIVAIAASTALGGLVISPKALEFKFDRLNPIKGVKQRIFSAQMFVELGKTIGKAFLIGTVGVMSITYFLPEMTDLMNTNLGAGVARAIELVALCSLFIISSLLLIALIDVPWQMYSHLKKLRMTKDEVRREHKESEGDPQLKARIRSQQQERARSRMIQAVPNADVIITNPTHYAVALRYQDGQMAAPVLLAKGQGHVAKRIIAIGQEYAIPQLNAPPLARAIYRHVDLEHAIPEDLYAAVAQVLAWAYQLKRWESGLDNQKPPTPNNLDVPSHLDPQQ